jgi:hypothetical protein
MGSSAGSAATIPSTTAVPTAVVVPRQYAVARNVIGWSERDTAVCRFCTEGAGAGEFWGEATGGGGLTGEEAGWILPAQA